MEHNYQMCWKTKVILDIVIPNFVKSFSVTLTEPAVIDIEAQGWAVLSLADCVN